MIGSKYGSNENGIYNATHRFLENDTGNVENSHTK